MEIAVEQHRRDSFLRKNDVVPLLLSSNNKSINTMIKEAERLAELGFYVDDVDFMKKCHVCSSEEHKPDCWYPKFLAFMNAYAAKPFEQFDHLKFEANRVCTFIDWIIPEISPFLLARSGFYFTRENDRVQCVFCNGVIENWKLKKDPNDEHKRLYAQCPYLNGAAVGNVPIPVSEILIKYRKQAMIHQQPRILEPYYRFNGKFTDVQSLSTRLASFSGWCCGDVCDCGDDEAIFNNVWPNEGRGLPPILDMALSGFSYCGFIDHIACFYCGLRLQGLKYNDDVDAIHQFWSPGCIHVNQTLRYRVDDNRCKHTSPKPPELSEECENKDRREGFAFEDDEIDFMMQELDILRNAGDIDVSHAGDVDVSPPEKILLYPNVRNVFVKRLKEKGMLYRCVRECIKDAVDNYNECLMK